MRKFAQDYASGPGTAGGEILWNCLRQLGDTAMRVRAGPRRLSQALAGLPLIDVYGGNRLVRTAAACCPEASGPAEQGAWLYGPSLALHYRQEPALMLASGLPPGCPDETAALLFFDGRGALTQAVAPAGEGRPHRLDSLIRDFRHPRQDCLPELTCGMAPVRAPRAAELSELERSWCRCATEAGFSRVLARRNLDRARVYHQIGDQYAAPVALETLPSVLALAQTRGLALRVTQRIAHGRQQYSGVPHARSWHRDRLSFCLGPSRHEWHCRHLGSVWRVRRPGLEGIETALEILDDQGELALVLAGVPERPWRRLLADALYPPGGR